MSEYNSDLARLKQAEYCKTNGPHFAPESGRCWKCKRGIYQKIGWKFENHRAIEVSLDSPDAKHFTAVSYTHLRAHETRHDLVCRLLLEKKKKKKNITR